MSVKKYACVLLVCLLSACRSTARVQPEVTVAAAANLTDVLHVLGSQFGAQSGVHPVFSFASTSQLARQIESSAPFDVFMAADAQHVDDLDKKGLLVRGSKAVYATGVLALWFPAVQNAGGLEDLMRPEVHVIAIAKPELAPYGQAAVDSLKHAGLWEKVQSKVVYAENISMAKQYGASHNADAVFTAYSLVLKEGGKTIHVDENLHDPITQELAIIANSRHQDAASQFVNFVLKGQGREVLEAYGYRVPGAP